MAVILLPTTMLFGDGCTLGRQYYGLTAASETTGSEQTRLLGPTRWVLSLVQPDFAPLGSGEGARWQALAAQLRGRVNILGAFDPVAYQPRGTLRGTLTLAAAAAAGATSISVTGGSGQAGRTLLVGDKLQVSTGVGTSQLVMCVADATANASGALTVQLDEPLRDAYPSATAVTWDHPLAYYRAQASRSTWKYGRSGTAISGVALDLLETWTA